MNVNELKVELARNGISIPRLAEKIGIGKKALYAKISGVSSFKQKEILAIMKELNLSSQRMCEIFFADCVS